MLSYFLVIILLLLLIRILIKYFNIQIYKQGQLLSYLIGLFLIFVIPGFMVDWIAVKLEWYVFPQTTTYLWRTPVGIPVEEILFFITVPLLILVLWKISKKILFLK
jgi:hypothetical protein